MSSSSYDLHIHDSCLLQNELRNIRNVIQVITANLSALTARFSDVRDPPAMFITEQRELSSKLQELRQKELQLSQQLNETRKSEKSVAKFIRAHLPNKQRTSIPLKPGKRSPPPWRIQRGPEGTRPPPKFGI